jgi:predicted transcriptional regulator
MRKPSESKTRWGTLLRQLREDAGMSARYAASQASVNRKTLRNLEDGTGAASAADIEALLRLYGYELEAVKIQPNPSSR